MPNPGAKLATITISCCIVILYNASSWSAPSDPSTPAELLASKGVTKIKGRYFLLAEQSAFDQCQETLSAYASADKAMQAVNSVEANQQAYNVMKQRYAADRAAVQDMRVIMRDGKTLEMQQEIRALEIDRNNARGNAGILSPNRPTQRQKKKMADQAQDAIRNADESKAELRRKVQEVVNEYQALGADSKIREALGTAKFGPSDGFSKLAGRLGITLIPQMSVTSKKKTEMAQRSSDALQELREAETRVDGIKFRGGELFKVRDKRRTDTLDAIRLAIAKLEAGETETKPVDKAFKLNDGYDSEPMSQKWRDDIQEAGKRLKKAASLLGDTP